MGFIRDWKIKQNISRLKNKNDSQQASAVRALRNIGKPAVELLILALKDDDYYVRQMAAEVLGKIGDSRAVEPLILALMDNYEDHYKFKTSLIGFDVVKALKEITGEDFGYDAEMVEGTGSKRCSQILIFFNQGRSRT